MELEGTAEVIVPTRSRCCCPDMGRDRIPSRGIAEPLMGDLERGGTTCRASKTPAGYHYHRRRPTHAPEEVRHPPRRVRANRWRIPGLAADYLGGGRIATT